MNARALRFVIHGEPASKANSREIVTRKMRDAKGKTRARPMSIKSEKARDFEKTAQLQIPAWARVELEGPVRVVMKIFYASQRPDLDESVVLDVMQSKYQTVRMKGRDVRKCIRKGVYVNDRQVKQKFVMHGIDAHDPRAEVLVVPLQAQQLALDLEDVPLDVFETV
jgi:hypothetical protein